MENIDTNIENRISKRYIILNKIDYYIEESVYYRSFSDEIINENRKVLFNSSSSEGKLKIE